MAEAGIALRQVGFEWGRKGMSDGEILAHLRREKRVTFVTFDAHFYRREYCHAGYCLVQLAIPPGQVAYYAKRFFRRRSFRTFAARQAKVVRVQPTGVVCWEQNAPREIEIAWR